MVRGAKIRRILNLLDHLPQGSAYRGAVLLDGEHLGAILEAQEDQAKSEPHPLQAEHGYTEELLAMLVDAVRENTSVAVAAAGGKPRPVKPLPRPETAAPQIDDTDRLKKHREVVSRVLPGRTPEQEAQHRALWQVDSTQS